GEPSWDAVDALEVPVEGLAVDTDYALVLSGFTDAAGNPLDGAPVLEDGALDFRTGPDETPPTVRESTPAEGTVDVARSTSLVTVVFDEPMDVSTGTAVLAGGDFTSDALSPSWSADGMEASFRVPELLGVETAYALTLNDFADGAGNALDGEPYLGDGAVDFTTGGDLFAPYVLASTPIEGTTEARFEGDTITIAFSEVMETSATSVPVTSELGTFDAPASWSGGGAILSLDVTGQLFAGLTYRVDLSGFSDAGGTALDTTHFYLGDGALDFTTLPATGESCREALGALDATEVMPGVFQWVIEEDQVLENEGSAPCDSSHSDDAVIRVRKAAADTVLHVLVSSDDSSDEVNVDVLQGVCDPMDAMAEAARFRCLERRDDHEAFVEGPAGFVYLWISQDNTGGFDGATVTVEEIPALPEGESCSAPLTTAATRYYTAPAGADDFHTWEVPMDGVAGYDRGTSWDDAGDFSCDSDGESGGDFVVQVDKTTDSSILQVQVDVAGSNANVEVLEGACAVDAAGVTVRSCEEDFEGSLSYDLSGPAGPRFIWVGDDDDPGFGDDFPSAFPPTATVRVREVEPGPGDSCGEGVVLTPGADVPITADRALDLGVPSCFGSSGTTWFRFTASSTLTVVNGNGALPLAGTDAASGDELSCVSDASQGVAMFTEPGRDYCLAVASGAAVTALSFEEIPYPGVSGSTVTDLMVSQPGSTGRTGFDPEDWMVVTPTYVYLAAEGDLLWRAPRAGMVDAEELLGEDSSLIGNAGVAVGEAVFSLDNSTSAETRLWRLVDETGTYGATDWDGAFSWPGEAIDAMTWDGTSLILVTETDTVLPSVTPPARIYTADPTTPGTVMEVGTNDTLNDVSAVAADASWLYFVAEIGGTEGIYRLDRSQLGDPAAPLEEVYTGGINYNDDASLVLQPADGGAPAVLYFRGYNPADVFAILDPGGASPRFLGRIFDLGRDNDDFVLALDPAIPALFLTEEETDLSDPRWLRVE
ncbi:MAG TPA: Ig-like domain-containing protein, partial [Polyangiaceae bacterium LLY-WYZ-15_(1-7)]|nr:Ig-like domain-containing protein [Polyangiaceae bacterium LLY-WYZ-15_(1-7)]